MRGLYFKYTKKRSNTAPVHHLSFLPRKTSHYRWRRRYPLGRSLTCCWCCYRWLFCERGKNKAWRTQWLSSTRCKWQFDYKTNTLRPETILWDRFNVLYHSCLWNIQKGSLTSPVYKARKGDYTSTTWINAQSNLGRGRGVHQSSIQTFIGVSCFTLIPAVGYAAAVASHPQAFLQVRGKAWGSDASAAVGTHTLFVFPLVVHLAEHIQPRLVHDFWKFKSQQ